MPDETRVYSQLVRIFNSKYLIKAPQTDCVMLNPIHTCTPCVTNIDTVNVVYLTNTMCINHDSCNLPTKPCTPAPCKHSYPSLQSINDNRYKCFKF